MSKKTHSKSPSVTAARLDEAKALVDQVMALVGPVPSLSLADIRRSAKPRPGSDKVVATIAALSEQFGLELPATISPADIRARQKLSRDLIPLQKKLVAATKQVNDLIFAAGSESWAGTTTHYTVLKRLAVANGDLQASLAPVRSFFARRTNEVVNQEKELKATRKVTRTNDAAAKAKAELDAIQRK